MPSFVDGHHSYRFPTHCLFYTWLRRVGGEQVTVGLRAPDGSPAMG
ncbi:hypothetical protein JZ785_00675 [Alicyclobacillus curvatus]|nr:hypothetical protein JZ785_00675 [Alicyclobacillus curvatus]